MIVRVYEVTDLVAFVPDYEYSQATQRSMGGGSHSPRYGGGVSMPGMGGMGSGLAGGGMMPGAGGGSMMPAPPSAAYFAAASPPGISMNDLVTAITKTCGDGCWGDMEGGGVVEPLGYSLVVLHRDAVHKQIQDLLDQLRQGAGKRKTVSIDARWLVLNSDGLEKLTPTGAEGKAQVDREALAEFTRQPTSLRAMTNCFSGQLVYLVSGTRQNIVTGVIPVVGRIDRPDGNDAPYASRHVSEGPFMFVSQRDDSGVSSSAAGGSVGYQPMVEKSIFGAWLEIRPTLIPEDNAAIVDLRSTITALGKPMTVLAPQPPQAVGAPQVDRIAVDTLELATTMRVPLGQPMLIGGLTRVDSSTLGMTSLGDPDAAASKEPQETPQLYLILELKDDSVK
jgi:hypothetical protein